MIPVNQFILGGSDPLLYPSEKMTNSIDEQNYKRELSSDSSLFYLSKF